MATKVKSANPFKGMVPDKAITGRDKGPPNPRRRPPATPDQKDAARKSLREQLGSHYLDLEEQKLELLMGRLRNDEFRDRTWKAPHNDLGEGEEPGKGEYTVVGPSSKKYPHGQGI